MGAPGAPPRPPRCAACRLAASGVAPVEPPQAPLLAPDGLRRVAPPRLPRWGASSGVTVSGPGGSRDPRAPFTIFKRILQAQGAFRGNGGREPSIEGLRPRVGEARRRGDRRRPEGVENDEARTLKTLGPDPRRPRVPATAA